MQNRRWLAAALVVGYLGAAGCGDTTESDEADVPAGAIPAAPDVRPGGEPELNPAGGPDSAAATGGAGAAGMPNDTITVPTDTV